MRNIGAVLAGFKIVYSYVIRPVLKKAVTHTDFKWDDRMLEITDYIFEYEPNAEQIQTKFEGGE